MGERAADGRKALRGTFHSLADGRRRRVSFRRRISRRLLPFPEQGGLRDSALQPRDADRSSPDGRDPPCLDRPSGRSDTEIGRASCRERGCQYGLISVVAVSLKKKNNKEYNKTYT